MDSQQLLEFIEEWFRGPCGIGGSAYMREFGWVIGNNKEEFRRDEMTIDGFKIIVWPKVMNRIGRLNIFMGIRYWPAADIEPSTNNTLYDRLTYDLDSKNDPKIALRYALKLAKAVEEEYGANVIVVESGFKGAHVHIPLKPSISWVEYRALWSFISREIPKAINDTDMLQENRLSRIPLTVNFKNEGCRWARIIYPKKYWWGEFRWNELQPLDPRRINLFTMEFRIPEIVYVSHGRVKWIDNLIENGVPDGRRRLLAFAIIPYLVNVKGLEINESLKEIKKFLEASCGKFKNCREISEKEIMYSIKRIRRMNVKPIRMEKLKKDHKELYEMLVKEGILKP
jgi:hypothetical protein